MAEYQATSGRVLTLPCIICGTPFTFSTKPKGRYPRFCSEPCREKRARRVIEPKQCQTCAREFLPQRVSRSATKHGLYCSLECRPQCEKIDPVELDAHERRDRQLTRARKKGADPIERVDCRDIFARDEWTCRICGEPVDRTLKAPDHRAVCLNHVVPLSKGGDHTPTNLQCAHWICSSLRADRVEV